MVAAASGPDLRAGCISEPQMSKISDSAQDFVRRHLVAGNLDAAYRQMAEELTREAEALEWAEGTFADGGQAVRAP
jgi:hypothetical protein